MKWPCQLIGARRAALSQSQAELWLSQSWCTLIVVWMAGMYNDNMLVDVMEWDNCSLHRPLTSYDPEPSSHNVCLHTQGLTAQHKLITYMQSHKPSKSNRQFTDQTNPANRNPPWSDTCMKEHCCEHRRLKWPQASTEHIWQQFDEDGGKMIETSAWRHADNQSVFTLISVRQLRGFGLSSLQKASMVCSRIVVWHVVSIMDLYWS